MRIFRGKRSLGWPQGNFADTNRIQDLARFFSMIDQSELRQPEKNLQQSLLVSLERRGRGRR